MKISLYSILFTYILTTQLFSLSLAEGTFIQSITSPEGTYVLYEKADQYDGKVKSKSWRFYKLDNKLQYKFIAEVQNPPTFFSSRLYISDYNDIIISIDSYMNSITILNRKGKELKTFFGSDIGGFHAKDLSIRAYSYFSSDQNEFIISPEDNLNNYTQQAEDVVINLTDLSITRRKYQYIVSTHMTKQTKHLLIIVSLVLIIIILSTTLVKKLITNGST